MSTFSKIKNFFGSRSKGDDQEIDVNKPVTNPQLKKAFADFNRVKTEANLQLLVAELKNATFLMVVLNDGLQITQSDGQGKGAIEKGSIIKFHLFKDAEGRTIYPLFTDWNEIDLWFKTREGFVGFISSARATYEFVLMSEAANGLVINPSSDNWTMERKQIEELVKDNPQ